MGLNFLAIDPIAFELFGWPVRWYGIIIGLAILVGYILFTREASRKGIDSDTSFDLLFWTVIFGLVGARIYYVIFSSNSYLSDPLSIFRVWEGGMAIYGGVIGGAITIYVLCQRYKLSVINVFDIAIPALFAGQLIGRWGNFMNQEAHGTEVTRQFLEGLHLPEFVIEGMHIGSHYYHPTFLYESIGNICLFLIITLVIYKIYNRHGQLFFSYFIGYGIIRFFVEALRTDSLKLGPIRMAQLTGIVGALVGIVGVLYLMKKGTKVTDETRMKLF